MARCLTSLALLGHSPLLTLDLALIWLILGNIEETSLTKGFTELR